MLAALQAWQQRASMGSSPDALTHAEVDALCARLRTPDTVQGPLAAIVAEVNGTEWTAHTVAAIAAHLRRAGFEIRDGR